MMKRTWTAIPFCLLLVVVAVNSAAGQQVVQPPKGATLIRVHLRLLPDSAYLVAAATLRAHNYFINVSDSVPTALTTDAQYVPGIGLVEISARVLADTTGSVVEVNGSYRRLIRLLHFFSAVSSNRQAIAYGAGGSRELQAWNELAAIALDFGGNNVTYGMPPPR